MPGPDATVVRSPVWSPATIDEWQKQRPGSGRWGRGTSRRKTNVQLAPDESTQPPP